MLKLATILALLCTAGAVLADADPGLQNVHAREGMTLNGKWHVIVDPYENGFYNYRREPFDAEPNPTGGYFLDRKPADRSDLVEYDFDTSPTLTVPGDWNSQDDGSITTKVRCGIGASSTTRRPHRVGAYSCISAPPTTRRMSI